MSINCEDIKENIFEILNKNSEFDEKEVEIHLTKCKACNDLIEKSGSLIDLIELPILPTYDLDEPIMRTVKKEKFRERIGKFAYDISHVIRTSNFVPIPIGTLLNRSKSAILHCYKFSFPENLEFLSIIYEFEFRERPIIESEDDYVNLKPNKNSEYLLKLKSDVFNDAKEKNMKYYCFFHSEPFQNGGVEDGEILSSKLFDFLEKLPETSCVIIDFSEKEIESN